MLTLRTFAQACATLVSSHVQALVPYLVVRQSACAEHACISWPLHIVRSCAPQDPRTVDAQLIVLEILEIVIPVSAKVDALQVQVSDSSFRRFPLIVSPARSSFSPGEGIVNSTRASFYV